MRCFYGHTTNCVVECHSDSAFCPQDISESLNQISMDQDQEDFTSYDFEHGLSLNDVDAWGLPTRESRVHLRSPASQVSNQSLFYCMQLN
jgi:hypothetical protein